MYMNSVLPCRFSGIVWFMLCVPYSLQVFIYVHISICLCWGQYIIYIHTYTSIIISIVHLIYRWTRWMSHMVTCLIVDWALYCHQPGALCRVRVDGNRFSIHSQASGQLLYWLPSASRQSEWAMNKMDTAVVGHASDWGNSNDYVCGFVHILGENWSYILKFWSWSLRMDPPCSVAGKICICGNARFFFLGHRKCSPTTIAS